MSRNTILKRIEALEDSLLPASICVLHFGEPSRNVDVCEYLEETSPNNHKWLVHPDHIQEFEKVVSERFNLPDAEGRAPFNIILAVHEPVREVKITRGE